ncbi:MAG: class I SAM-dependent methyltransferase [Nitrospiraceae bacterium]|nr:class I SAM-dependent methyltransferase [Nitrospiraceae bacterium]
MGQFEQSHWAEPDFSRKFVESADIAIVERKRSHAIMKSFFRHQFMHKDGRIDLLDLGCGDGILTYELMQTEVPLSATLVDGSEEMLGKAKERLKDYPDILAVRASFQELIGGKVIADDFDFIVSSLAIHHLDMKEKRELFGWVYARLRNNGCFMNIDVVLAPNEVLEEWYMVLWQEWITEKKKETGITGDIYGDTMKRYKDNRDNKPDSLDSQMDALKAIGFRDMDCYYKYGIFTIYGGRK